MHRALAVVIVLAGFVLVPNAQAVPVTLYAHVLNAFQEFPLNTQVPERGFVFDQGAGIFATTVKCLPQPPGFVTSTDWHTLYGYPIPSLVNYTAHRDGMPQVHPERGLWADVQLDPATPMVLHWYLSEPDVTQADVAQPLPTPNVVVRATMRAGDALSIDDQAYNSGPVLAQGESVPALLAGSASQGVETSEVAGRTVYHFVVPMDIEVPLIPSSTGFNRASMSSPSPRPARMAD